MTTLFVSPKSIFQYAIASINKRIVREDSKPVYKPEITQDAISKAFLRYEATLSPTVKMQLNGRLERGLSMARYGSVSYTADPSLISRQSQFWVKSSVPGKPAYLVNVFQRTCTCPDFYKGNLCKHLFAANIVATAIDATPKPVTPPKPIAPPTPINPPQPVTPSPPIVSPKPVTQSQSTVPPKPVKLRQVVTTPIPATQPKTALVKETTLPSSPAPLGTQTKQTDVITADIAQDSIIWGVIRHNGAILGLEVLRITGEQVTIRALPKVIEGNKLQPQFPFDGKRCIATVPKEQLSHVRIFR